MAENSFEAILSFNEDMKVLAMNSYQMQDLLQLSIKENEVLLSMFDKIETQTINVGKKVSELCDFTLDGEIQKNYNIQ